VPGLLTGTLVALAVLANPSIGQAQSLPSSATIQASARILDPSTVVGSRSVAAVGGSSDTAAAGLSVAGAPTAYRIQVRSSAGAAPAILLRGTGPSTFSWNSLATRLEAAPDFRTASPRVLEVVLEVLD
jgi:hypothetical protein